MGFECQQLKTLLLEQDEDYNVEGLLLLVKALHTSILFILMFFTCFFLYFSRLVQVVMKTALTVTLIIMMIVTRIPLVQVSVVAEVVELEVVVTEVERVMEEANVKDAPETEMVAQPLQLDGAIFCLLPPFIHTQ